MIISHNISALKAANSLQKNSNNQSSALQKLSSGLKINQAAEDAAGLAISEKMKGQIKGLSQAQQNIQDGISLIQVAEGGLGEIQNPSLQRLRELAVQAANGSLTEKDRSIIQVEVNQIKKHIDEIASNTEFNGINLLNQQTTEVSVSHKIIEQAEVALLIGSSTVPLSLEIESGINDQFTFQLNDQEVGISLTPGSYNRDGFLTEINKQFQQNNISLTASLTNENRLKFTSPEGDYSIESAEGSAANSFLISNGQAYRNGGTSLAGIPISPGVVIEEGINDNLSFTVGSSAYSIMLESGTYEVYDRFQDHLNEDSPLLAEINEKLELAEVPVKAQFIKYANSDDPYNNGTGLYFTAFESPSGTHHISDGTFSFGGFGGNAKETLFDQYDKNWTFYDSSNMETGEIKTYPATAGGNADLSGGLTITEGENDTLNFLANESTFTINLAAGSYDQEGLINELNTQLSGLPIDITASYRADNKLVLSQNDALAGENFYDMSGNALMDLFFENQSGKEAEVEVTVHLEKGIKNFQTGANSGEVLKIQLTDARVAALGINEMNLETRKGAEHAIGLVDGAMEKVSAERGKFGSYQNRLEHQLNNSTNYESNLVAAKARITDADIAKQTILQTKEKILAEASTNMLVLANQQSESVIQLLR